ncbi:class D beta-lactamase [Robiginitomaculum antarcticum]|uniref:class D beta-lactamase n=1 Tax=Robiginitomaculum antarcticum TaxID=437507 RepID=UPI00146167F1|nr:class D beta-lactamase [Robiginitomaculum antarcticum]
MYACIILMACGEAVKQQNPINVSAIVMENGVAPDHSALKVIRLSDGQIWQSGGARLAQRYPPASTSKIPHTLIMIEDGFASPETIFEWDGTQRTFDIWNRDHTLASAFQYSAVWVYQFLAAQQGHDAMSAWMARLNYGNANIGDEDDLTTYWLLGPLEISVDEQIDFLTRLSGRKLPFSTSTYDISFPLMIEQSAADYTLYAKTGWRSDGENMDIGWYVGWIETVHSGTSDTYVFAFNMDMPDGEGREKRKTVVKAALTSIGAFGELP